MNPIYMRNNILRSDNAVESAEEQARRRERQRRLVSSKNVPSATHLGEKQLDAFLRNPQKPEPSATRSGIESSKQVESLPVPASLGKEFASKTEEINPFLATSGDNLESLLSDGENKIIPNDKNRQLISTNVVSSENGNLHLQDKATPDKAMTSVLEKLRDSLDKDISSFSSKDLLSYLENLRSMVSSNNLTQNLEQNLTQNLTQNKPSNIDSDLLFDAQLFKETMIALDFMQGYSDAQSMQLHERQQIEQAFNTIREQLFSSYPDAAVPSSTMMQIQVAGLISSNNLSNPSDKKSINSISTKKDKNLVVDEPEKNIDISIGGSTEFAKQVMFADLNAALRSRTRKNEKEKEESTLPLIIQRSA
jgi:hypothetical protein